MKPIIFLFLLATSFQCQNNRNLSNEAIFSNIANIIFQTYSDLFDASSLTKRAFLAYKNNRSIVNLQTLRDAWITARSYMKKLEVVNFGPAIESNRHIRLDSWSKGFYLCTKKNDKSGLITNSGLCTQTIEELILNSTNILTGNNRHQGFEAVEYLLYDNGNGQADINEVFSVLKNNRLNYLNLLINDIVIISEELADQWNPAKHNFSKELSNAGKNSTVFSTQEKAMSELLLQILVAIETIRDLRVGQPAGFTQKFFNKSNFERIESRFKNHSLEDIINSIEGIESIWTGTYKNRGNLGFGEFVNRNDQALNSKVLKEFQRIKGKTLIIKRDYGTLRKALIQNNQVIRELFDLMKPLQILLVTDVVNATGSNPGISPNDGD